MLRSGKVHFFTLIAIVSAVLVLALFFLGGSSPRSAAGEFLDALARGDVQKLSELSYLDGATPEDVKKEWQYTMDVVAKHYRFGWRIVGEQLNSDNVASVRVEFVKDANKPTAYPENMGLSMVRKDGKWLVDVKSIPREFFPGLPR